MSKKDKSKFRKQIKAQMLQDMAKVESQSQMKATSKIQVSQPFLNQPKIVSQQNTTAAISDSEINLPQIKYDLKKTGVVVGSIAVIIAALYFLDLKYNILANFGDRLFNVFHIR